MWISWSDVATAYPPPEPAGNHSRFVHVPTRMRALWPIYLIRYVLVGIILLQKLIYKTYNLMPLIDSLPWCAVQWCNLRSRPTVYQLLITHQPICSRDLLIHPLSCEQEAKWPQKIDYVTSKKFPGEVDTWMRKSRRHDPWFPRHFAASRGRAGDGVPVTGTARAVPITPLMTRVKWLDSFSLVSLKKGGGPKPIPAGLGNAWYQASALSGLHLLSAALPHPSVLTMDFP